MAQGAGSAEMHGLAHPVFDDLGCRPIERGETFKPASGRIAGLGMEEVGRLEFGEVELEPIGSCDLAKQTRKLTDALVLSRSWRIVSSSSLVLLFFFSGDVLVLIKRTRRVVACFIRTLITALECGVFRVLLSAVRYLEVFR